MSFRRALVGVDGHDGGRDAIALARALGAAEIVLAGVYLSGKVPDSEVLKRWDDMLRQETLEMLEAARAEAGIDAELVAVGDRSPARALHRVASEREADVLVLGSSRRGRLGRVLAGDVARSALYDAPCAVAVAPREFRAQAAPVQQVGVAFDASPEARAALERAAAFAAAGEGRRLVLLTVVPEAWHSALAGVIIDWPEVLREEHDHALTAARAALSEAGVEGEVVVERGDLDTLIAATEGFDVVFTGSRGYGPVERVVLGSVSDRLVHEARCPVVVAPRPAG
jgi:nucleotide-binding universal stress UspA family protein